VSIVNREQPSSTGFENLVLAALPEPLCVVDAAGVVVYANRAASAALGTSERDETLGALTLVPDGWVMSLDGTRLLAAAWSVPMQTPDGPTVLVGVCLNDSHDLGASATCHAPVQRRIHDAALRARRQIASDLHDGAQQRLVNLLIGLQLVRDDLPADSPVCSPLDEVIAEARLAITDARELASGIHPSILVNYGLVAAVRALAARAATPTKVSAWISGDLSTEIEVGAHFLIAEGLAKAVKHAGAENIWISIAGNDLSLILTVEDDGIGGARTESGHGLIGMGDRAGVLGGHLQIRSVHGQGTRVVATLPLARTSVTDVGQASPEAHASRL
jgi:signal transduction histidine kinase